MAGRKSSRQRGFGIFLVSLRQSTGHSQKTLAKKLPVSRSLVAAIETGRLPPTSDFVADLIKTFPEQKTAINEAAKPYVTFTNPKVAVRRSRHLVWEQISDLHASKNWPETKIAIQREWELLSDNIDKPSLAVAFCVFLNDLYLRRETMLTGPMSSDTTPIGAARLIASNPSTPEHERAASWKMIVDAYERHDSQHTLTALNDVLQRLPTAGELWRLKAMVCLERKSISDANAALVMAQLYGASPCNIRYVRGLILTEWHKYAEAIAELSEALTVSRLTDADIARARATRAFAFFKNSQTSDSIEEFVAMEESMPDNAWAHYFHGQCYAQSDTWQPATRDDAGRLVYPSEQLERDETVLSHFESALQCQEPPLSIGKWEETEESASWLQSKVKGCREEVCQNN